MVHEYTFKISVRNNGSAVSDAVATLKEIRSGWIIDGKSSIGAIPSAGTLISPDVVVVRVDLAVAPRPTLEDLKWEFSATTADERIAIDPVQPAEVVKLELAHLGFPSGADSVTVKGAAVDAKISGHYLSFLSPGDIGQDQVAEFTLAKGSVIKTFVVPIQSERRLAVVWNHEGPDEPAPGMAIPRLVVSGLGPDNNFTGAPITFKLADVPLMQLAEESTGTILNAESKGVEDLRNYWTFNPADNSFTISADKVPLLLSQLSAGSFTINVNFVASDKEFAANFDILTAIKGATVSGVLLNEDGSPATSLAGKKMLLRGFNEAIRKTAVVDSSGKFSFENILPDTYAVSLSDLDHPDSVFTTFPIYDDSTMAEVTIVYTSGEGVMSAKAASGSAPVKAVSPMSSVKQNGQPPKRRSISPQKNRIPSPDVTPSSAGTQSFSAIAEAEGAPMTTPIAYTVPMGTTKVDVTVTVSTDEYPVFTTQKGRYNDTWK